MTIPSKHFDHEIILYHQKRVFSLLTRDIQKQGGLDCKHKTISIRDRGTEKVINHSNILFPVHCRVCFDDKKPIYLLLAHPQTKNAVVHTLKKCQLN